MSNDVCWCGGQISMPLSHAQDCPYGPEDYYETERGYAQCVAVFVLCVVLIFVLELAHAC